MKTKALKHFRAKLASNQPAYGIWATLESASVTEMAVSLAVDWVVVDAEHGHLDWKEINEHIRAGVRSNTVILVRLAERSTALTKDRAGNYCRSYARQSVVRPPSGDGSYAKSDSNFPLNAKRALDIGADGVVIPWVSTVEELEEAIRDARYPNEGRRGIGGERATAWGQSCADHTSEANDHVLVIPLIENVAAIPHVPAMCEVDGTDVIFFGPNDFSATAGYRGQWEGPGVAEQILELKDKIRAAGKHAGLMTTSIENLLQRREQGFRMMGIGSDSGLMLRSIHQALQAVDRDRVPAASLDPADGRDIRLPLSQPPAGTEPDHNEVITSLSGGETVELETGVVMEALVGDFNTARGLTTGIVTIQPEALLPYHTHPCGESITVIEGEAEISVEGRVYRLGPLDNITIPRWLSHQARNPNSRAASRLHVALAMSTPQRELVDRAFAQTEMPSDSRGTPGFERVTRFATAKRLQGVGPGAEFVDYFNSELMPGIEMSGGFARLDPGGRLPDHIHDFDESICIVQGTANCLVEGRKYLLGDCATAMVPRGRVHYFINESKKPMDMVWVYAGPMPERIVIEPGFVRETVAS